LPLCFRFRLCSSAPTSRRHSGPALRLHAAHGGTAPQISGEQENQIRASVKSAKVDHVAKLAVPLTVGASVPRKLHFYPFPKEAAEIAPQYGGYFSVAQFCPVVEPLFDSRSKPRSTQIPDV
jgi:hypothetical protein